MNGIQQIAAKGRYGDNHLLHVSDAELQGLNALANEKFGRGLTTNPDTGLPEAFLFAPLLAPALMGAAGGALGTGALATGLVAGGLGAAEAAARGMDDPLQRGLMAGLTAGAGSALGESLAGAADTSTQLGAMDASQQAVLNQATPQGVDFSGVGQMNAATATPPGAPQFPTAEGSIGRAGLPTAPPPAYNASAPVASPEAFENALQVESDIAQGAYAAPTQSMFGQYAEAPKAFQGAKNILSDPSGKALGTFVSENKLPLAAGAVGLGGQAQLGAQQEMRERKEAMDEEKAAELKATQDIIRRNYADVGRALPTNPYTGRPIFANGGIVGLMEGGRPFDKARGYAAGGSAGEPSELFRALFGTSGITKPTGYTASGEAIYPYNPVTGEGMNGFQKMMFKLMGNANAQAMPRQTTSEADPKFQQFLGHLQGGAGNKAAAEASGYGKAAGGYLETGGRVGDGMSDDIPATIDGTQPAALSDGEFVIPADVVSHLGNGSSDAGAQQLYSMMDRIRQARTGTKEQGKEINAKKYMPA